MEVEEREQERFRVVAYSGYQGEQEPRALVVDGERLDVVAIRDRWYDPQARYFRVEASDGRCYLLRCELDELEWSRVRTSGKLRSFETSVALLDAGVRKGT